MKTLDFRFDAGMIQNWIGRRFDKYKCDAFEFTNSVTQIVGLYIGDDVYALTNVQEPVDYFGTAEDIAVMKFFVSSDDRIKSAFKDTEVISTQVEGEITSVKLVNECQKVSINGVPEYEVWLTRAIIIETGGLETSFEKDTVPFSEEITIRRGCDLINKISDNRDFLEEWGEGYSPEYVRDIVEIR